MLRRLIVRLFGLARRRRASFLNMMHGYRALKKAGRLDVIAEVKHALTVTPLGLAPGHLSPLLFGGALESGELAVRQYLLLRIGGLDLNGALLIALAMPEKGVVFPLPKPWRRTIEEHGFKVNHWLSAVLWAGYVLILFCYGCLRIAQIFLDGFRHKTDAYMPDEQHVYFADLSASNLPQNRETIVGHDIISWYLQWDYRKTDITGIRHNVRGGEPFQKNDVWIRAQSGPLPSLSGLNEVARYLAWSMKAMITSLFDMFRFRWWHALLLNQAALVAQARVARTEKLACEYFFHNSAWIYRPLWTYELERHGIRTWLYFYSTNIEGFKKEAGYSHVAYGYEAMSWPRYIVWDAWQKDFIERVALGNPEVIEAGEVWFSDNDQAVPNGDGHVVGVFDITPHRTSLYITLGLEIELYVSDVVNRFLDDILSCSAEHGYRAAWKRKRNVGKLVHPIHREYIKTIANLDALMMIDPDISAFRLIDACEIVVSMPFTSTALIARNRGKPSAYYDPTGLIQKDDHAAHGIPVLTGKDELRAWIGMHT